VSLADYQRELARMVADPRHRRRIAAQPGAALAGSRLDARERKRLTAFARDPGMRVNTVLYRANRLAPIHAALPRTCAALGEQLGPVLTAYWRSRAIEDLQFPSEVARFAAFLRPRLGRRDLALPGLGALLAVELAVFELIMAPRRAIRASGRRSGTRLHPLVRAVPTGVDPARIIAAVRGAPRASGRPGGILVDGRGEVVALIAVSRGELAHCRAAARGDALAPAARRWLDARGLLV
jgi:hypothetical protein